MQTGYIFSHVFVVTSQAQPPLLVEGVTFLGKGNSNCEALSGMRNE